MSKAGEEAYDLNDYAALLAELDREGFDFVASGSALAPEMGVCADVVDILSERMTPAV